MALSFICRECDREIITRYLKRGEQARCPHCNGYTSVPDDARDTAASPTIDQLKTQPVARPVESSGETRTQSNFPGIPGLFGLMCMVVFCSIVLIFPVLILVHVLELSDSARLLLLITVGQTAILLTALWGWRRTGLPFREVFPLHLVSPRLIGPLMLTILGFIIIQMKIIGLLFQIRPPSESELRLLNEPIAGRYWQLLVVGVILAPLAEEMLFRGVMIRGLNRHYGATAAIALTAFIFALVHPPIFKMIPTLLIGALLGWWFVTTGSLLPSIAGHAMNNFAVGWWAMIILGINPRYADDFVLDATFAGPSLWVSFIGLLMLGGGILWRYAERGKSG